MLQSRKQSYLKEKLKQALTSTFKVISDDFNITDKIEKNKKSDKYDFYEFQNLKNKNDFIKARAESGIHFLGYGFQEDTERIYIVEELESPDAAEKLFAKFENYPEEMGVDLSSVQIIPLED